MDVSLPVFARRRAEAKIEATRERERSRGRSGPVEYVAQCQMLLLFPRWLSKRFLRPCRLVSWVCDGCATALAVTGKGNAYDGWSGASCKGNAYGGWNGASSRNAAWTGVKHRSCTCEGYASASIASVSSRNCGDDYYGGRGFWCGNQIGIAPSFYPNQWQ